MTAPRLPSGTQMDGATARDLKRLRAELHGQYQTSVNLFDNPQMEVSQRGGVGAAAITILATKTFYADRWGAVNNTVGTQTWNMNTGTGFGIFPPEGRARPGVALYIIQTVADAALAAGDSSFVSYSWVGRDVQSLEWATARAKPLTVSFDIYCTVTTTLMAEFAKADGRNISIPFTTQAGVFKTITFTVPVDTGGTVFVDDDSTQLTMLIWTGAGSNLTSGTLNSSWSPSPATATRCVGMGNQFPATINNLLSITNMKAEVGSVATRFVPSPYSAELAKCQQYYLQTDKTNYGWGTVYGYGAAATSCGNYVSFPVPMRVQPIATINGTYAQTNCTIQTPLPDRFGGLHYVVVTALGAFNCNSNNSGYMTFSAEI